MVVNFRTVTFSLPVGWTVPPVPLPDPDRNFAAGPVPESDGSLRAGLIVTFVPMTVPDAHGALLHLIDQIRPSRPGMTDPVASDFCLGELPCDALRIRWPGPNGEVQEELLAIESNNAGERGFLFADAMFLVGDHETRRALEAALHTFTMRGHEKAT